MSAISLESHAVTERVAAPRDCVLAFGVPTSEEDFYLSVEDQNREYAGQYLGGWPQYHKLFGSRVEHYASRYTALGVQVVYGLRSVNLPALFTKGSVVTLFTHWGASGVEFCDGMLSLTDLIECIPEGFSGILDLCVCHPDDLVALLLRDRLQCTVRYISKRPAIPDFWLPFYAALYEILSLPPGQPYSRALTDLSIKLRHFDEEGHR